MVMSTRYFSQLIRTIRTMANEGIPSTEIEALCKTPHPFTKGFMCQQTMYRIKDPRKSLPFYTEVLGMTLLEQLHVPARKYSIFFLGHENPEDIPKDRNERVAWMMSKKGVLELTHNWGTENDDSSYHHGNTEPQGFGHIGIIVPSLKDACAKFDELGVKFVRRPEEFSAKGLAFIADPDGYWIELLDVNEILTN
ncbi:PREDICTED: lactoylglutathione lyase-like isoform X1 [Papilio xuthus]|uniref:lactoylglutathione lyase n=2 Tax=Papilio xuthus TaxID=66420 RepID=A0AAJ7E3S8_PAPXU|nr:PREDICTED: lactoylglutathione lyase-like isoform X1 [Papilio xuthus]